jgi:hypothetical protein
MNEYLQTMNVDPLAVEAHEKGEKDFDTFHTIDFMDHDKVRIMKRSRVNNDVCVELILGMESIEYLQPMNRPKCSVATSDHPGHLCIKSSLVTTDHGKAIVTDIKQLQENAIHDPILSTNENTSEQTSTPVIRNDVVLVQELTILNEETGKTHTTTRYFNPYYDTPPHLVPSAVRNMDDVDDDDK